MNSTIDLSDDLETFQFIITFSSDNATLLRDASEKYKHKADMVRRKENDAYSNSLYNKFRHWSLLLSHKADMIEAGSLR